MYMYNIFVYFFGVGKPTGFLFLCYSVLKESSSAGKTELQGARC